MNENAVDQGEQVVRRHFIERHQRQIFGERWLVEQLNYVGGYHDESQGKRKREDSNFYKRSGICQEKWHGIGNAGCVLLGAVILWQL